MKKIKKLLLACLSAACLTGCDCSLFGSSSEQVFTELCKHTIAHQGGIVYFYRDNDTDLIYFYWEQDNGVSVYYNKSGVPMKYDEFQKTHDREYHKDR